MSAPSVVVVLELERRPVVRVLADTDRGTCSAAWWLAAQRDAILLALDEAIDSLDGHCATLAREAA